MSKMNPMVTTIVQEIMITENDPDMWRKEMIRNHIFEAQEAKDLSEREVSLVHHALMVQRFSQMSSDDLMAEAKRYDLKYHVQFEADQLQMGAVSY